MAMCELRSKPEMPAGLMAQDAPPTKFPFYATQHQGGDPKSMASAVRTELASWPQNTHPALQRILLAQR